MRTFRKSAGTLCIAPGEIAFLGTNFILHRYAIRPARSSDGAKIARTQKSKL